MAVPRHLLAKSSDSPDEPRREETLPGHTALVIAAADELLAARGLASLRAAGLPLKLAEALSRIVRLAALAHDLGKCSDQFQQMVRREREQRQLVRHEALSLWLSWPGQLLHERLRSAVADDVEYRLAILAAAGHHRKFWAQAVAGDTEGAGTRLTLFVGHSDFLGTLRLGAEALALPWQDPLGDIVVEATRRSDPRRRFEAWQVEADGLIHRGSEEAKLLAVAKALVLAADVAGSALPRGGEEPRWVGRALAARAPPESMRAIVNKRIGGKPLRRFQEETAASAVAVTLVRAGCGTGKTIAAYLWSAERHPGSQLWVTYPTTGTATEGFRDYIEGADITGRLEHGRAEVDIEVLGLRDSADGTRDRDRLDAIRAWGCDVVTCTVDTVLGLLQNQRKGLYGWPGIAQAALVFDEIHAYDDQLFGSLLRFIEALPGIPALLMTASLPVPRLSALRDLVRRVHGVDLAEIPGPEDLERLPRYRLRTDQDAWEAARSCLARGGKVLWVSNTVGRCLAVSDRAQSEGFAPLVYHSRFRYRDRIERHRDVIEAFDRDGAAFATTTQVAEMSLDLSADLLVTDLAPVPALIQRLGRLNRRSTPERSLGVKPWVVVPFRGEPYAQRALDAAAEWRGRLAGRPLSQRDLVDAWMPEDGAVPGPLASTWLDGRFVTEPAPVREGTPGITILLEEDARAVREGRVRSVEVAIPMNPPPGKPGEWMAWPRVRYLPVPPAGLVTYDPMRGAQWRRGS